MRVLWICNIVLPEFCEEFNIKPTCYGGWMSGMLRQMEQVGNLVIGLCFPILDEKRMKDSVHGSHPFYSFHASMDLDDYKYAASNEFFHILKKFKPDVIHIWGTEYNHTKAAMDACIRLNMHEKVLIHIQGLVSYYSIHYSLGLGIEDLGEINYRLVLEGRDSFTKRGKVEQSVISDVKHVSGRTEWDYCCTTQLNKNIQYHRCDEILRSEFYCENQKWTLGNCTKYRIFLSQASYPIKGMHIFLKAMDIIQRQIADVEVYIGGNPPIIDDSNSRTSHYGTYLKKLYQSSMLADKIHFLGNISSEEMVEQYLHAHVFVSPSTVENSSNSICEAMILGVPVVASYVGGTPSLIRHGVDGFLYPCDAHYMLAYYIMQIFQYDELAGRISTAASDSARKRHDPEKIKNRMMEIYNSIASI